MLKRVVHAAIVLVAAGQAARGGVPAHLYVTETKGGAGLYRIDVATGDRTMVDLDDYPVVMKVERGVMLPSGAVLLSAVNAAQGRVLVAYDPASGTVTGISGHVDRTSDTPRGSGPDFSPGIGGLQVGPWGTVYVLREYAGLMRVELATGDREVVSQSVEPPVGGGLPLVQPVDLAVRADGSVLLAERLGGLVAVDPGTGDRVPAHTFPDIVEAWHRIDRLPDGRLVHAVGRGDGREVSVFDLSLTARAELSGPARGSGTPFAGIADIAVAPDGTVFVLDVALRAVLAVDARSGRRSVVSGGPENRGAGPVLPGPEAAPVLVRWEVPDRSAPRRPRPAAPSGR